MADAEATFELNLKEGTSGPAAVASKALDDLRGKIESDSRALGGMQRALKNIQGGTVVNVKQFNELKQAIGAKKAAIAEAQGAYLDLGGAFGKTAGASKGLQTKFESLLQQAKGAPGPLSQLAQSFERL